MRCEIVWKFVSRPPSQRWLTYGCPAASAISLMASRACFLVPTNSTVPPRCGEVGGELLRLLEQRLGLQQVDDVDAAALAVDEAAHLGVPAARLVAEVHAGLQQLPDADLSHGCSPLWLRWCGSRAQSARTRRMRAGQGPQPQGRGRPGSWDRTAPASASARDLGPVYARRRVAASPPRRALERSRAGPPFPYLRWTGPPTPASCRCARERGGEVVGQRRARRRPARR